MNEKETAAVAAPPMTMDVTVRPIEPKGSLLGFASVTFNHAVTVTDFKVLRGADGLYIGMPSKPDPGSHTGYTSTARITDSAIKQQLSEAVVTGYHAAVEKLKARVAAILAPDTGKEDKPPRIADQVKAAAKQAAQHNAALPDPAKEGRGKHAER